MGAGGMGAARGGRRPVGRAQCQRAAARRSATSSQTLHRLDHGDPHVARPPLAVEVTRADQQAARVRARSLGHGPGVGPRSGAPAPRGRSPRPACSPGSRPWRGRRPGSSAAPGSAPAARPRGRRRPGRRRRRPGPGPGTIRPACWRTAREVGHQLGVAGEEADPHPGQVRPLRQRVHGHHALQARLEDRTGRALPGELGVALVGEDRHPVPASPGGRRGQVGQPARRVGRRVDPEQQRPARRRPGAMAARSRPAAVGRGRRDGHGPAAGQGGPMA